MPGSKFYKSRAESDMTSSGSSKASPNRLEIDGMVALHTLISNKSKLNDESLQGEESDESLELEIFDERHPE